MYEELIKSLRAQADEWCRHCVYKDNGFVCKRKIMDCDEQVLLKAADAIEGLEEKAQTYAETLYAYEHPWISVIEQYPFAEYGEGKSVLTIDSMGEERVLYFNGSNWCWPTGEVLETARAFPITHWMPRPKPPKGE